MEITKEQLAEMLTGCEIGKETTSQNEFDAKENGLVIVFPYSDDNMELRGAFEEEYGCYDGGGFAFNKEGKFFDGDDDEQEVLEKHGVDITNLYPNWIKAKWNDGESNTDPAWTYECSMPCASFNIMEDGEIWAVGVVFSINDLI